MISSFRTAATVAALGALYGRAEHADLAKAIRVRTLVNLASGHETRILTNQNASAVLFHDLLAIPSTVSATNGAMVRRGCDARNRTNPILESKNDSEN